MTTHTPWHVDQTGEGTKIKDAGGNTVLWTQHTHLHGKRTDAEVQAIANLAAAAPDLLAALIVAKELVGYARHFGCNIDTEVALFEAVIARAEAPPMTAQANTTVSDDPMVTQAIRCDLWPEWLGELVEKAANAYVDKYDMSTEQAVAYGILLALDARRATADVTEAMVERAAKGLYEEDDVWSAALPWAKLAEASANGYRRLARAALIAALSQQAPE